MSEYVLLYRRNFASFVDFAFRELGWGEIYSDNWHIQLIANLLQYAWESNDPDTIRRQIFNLPPGYLKTLICSIAFPAWVLGRDPRKSVLIVSETAELALDIQSRCAQLMASRRYRAIFPRATIVSGGREIELSYGGMIRHGGINQSLPSRKSDLVVIDNPQSLHTISRRDLSARLEFGRLLKDRNWGSIVMNTRRLAANDMTHELRQQHSGWITFSMPVVAIHDKKWEFPPLDYHVQQKGDLLQHALEGWNEIHQALSELGGIGFSYQYLQGEYFPVSTGPYEVSVAGRKYQVIGEKDPTTIVSGFLAELKKLRTSSL